MGKTDLRIRLPVGAFFGGKLRIFLAPTAFEKKGLKTRLRRMTSAGLVKALGNMGPPMAAEGPRHRNCHLNYLRPRNDEGAQAAGLPMRPFMFLCPNTAYIVQARAEDAVTGEKPHTFHRVSCASCGRSHLVDPVTAELAVRGERRLTWPRSSPAALRYL